MLSGMAKKTYTTVTGVPLMRTGTWDASTGEISITQDMLQACVEAAESGLLDLAVIKIGHTDERFDNPEFMQDGNPAYGQVDNLEVIEEDGTHTLYGDFINIPEELAEIMASAYPYRSVEMDFGAQLLDENKKVTAEFPAVLTAVSLLGEAPPAVSGLGAIHQAFTKLTATGRVGHAAFTMHRFALTGGHTLGSLREALGNALRGRASDNEWTWVSDLDDQTVYYEHETAQGTKLWAETFTTNPDGTITLNGNAVEMIVQRVFKPVNGDTAPVPQPLAATHEPKGAQSPTVAATHSASHEKEEATMATSPDKVKKLREALGLGDDVTDEQITAVLDAENDDEANTEHEAEAPAEDEVEAPAEQVAATKQVTGLPETVQVSAAAFSQLQDQNAKLAQRVAAMEAKEAKERRDGIIQAAFAAGKLHPSEKQAFRDALDRDEQGTSALIDARHPAFPTQELGAGNAKFAHNTKETISEARQQTDAELFGRGGK